MQIELVSAVTDFWIHDCVIVSGENIDALVGDIPGVVDVPASCPFIGLGKEGTQSGGRPFHTRARRDEIGDEIAGEPLGGCPLGAIVGSTGDNAYAFDDGRPGDSELHCHKCARRNARN